MCIRDSMSCVPSRTSRSKEDISCVPSRTSLVFQAGHLVCSTQDIPCVRRQSFAALRNGSKCHTDLKIDESEAKFIEQLDFVVQKNLAPPKSIENHEKPEKKSKKKFRKQIFGVKKSKIANRPKRVLPKFRGDPSHVRRINGRSKFVAASAGFAKRKQLYKTNERMPNGLQKQTELGTKWRH